MQFVGHGHPAIRATHTKTLELSPGAELSERGTCIVAVGAEAQPARPLAGPVHIRISAAGHEAELDARANSSWTPDGPIVTRRSAFRLPGTFATEASAGAADLPRELVAALQDPDVLVTVEVEAVPEPTPTVVLFAADPSRPDDPRLQAEYDAADTVERQDAGARALVAAKRGDGPRTLVVATTDLPRLDRPPSGGGANDERRVEVVGVPAPLAVAVASGSDAAVVLVPDGVDPRPFLRRTPAGQHLAFACRPDELAGLLAAAHEQRGTSIAMVAQPLGPIVRADAGRLPELFGRDPVFVCLEASDRADAVDPAVRAAVAGLVADGVPTKTAAAALATLTGRSRRAAYDELIAARGAGTPP